MPAELWNYLTQIYGLALPDDRDVIERCVIDDSAECDGLQLKIELRRLQVSMSCRNWRHDGTVGDLEKSVFVEEMSRQTRLVDIAEKMRQLFHIPAEKKLKLFFKSRQQAVQDEERLTPVDHLAKNATLTNSGFGVNDIILGEVQNGNDAATTTTSSSETSPLTKPPGHEPPPLPTTVGSAHTSLTSSTFSTQTRQSSRNIDYNSFSNRHSDHKPGGLIQ